MTKSADYIARAKDALLGNYPPASVVLTEGSGVRVRDVDGKSYLDLAAGIAVLSLGHAHPQLSARIAEQAGRLMHVSNLVYNDTTIRFAEELVKRTPFARVFFCNSGTEANEAMLKLARRFHYERGDQQRVEIVTTEHSFHGRTYGALSVTGQPKYHVGMGPMLGGVETVPYGDLDAMKAVVSEKTAAILVEPLQAEGGLFVPPEGYLKGLRELADERGALLLFDEVQTGYGRLGTFLGGEVFGVIPDACSLAKGIAGGFPLGAMLVSDRIKEGLPPGSHASTFGGNPLACAAGLATLEVFDEADILGRVERLGAYLRERLEALVAELPEILVERRGLGLLQGVRLARGVDAAAIINRLVDGGVLATIAGGDVIRLSPPLIIEESELDEGLRILREVFDDLRKREA